MFERSPLHHWRLLLTFLWCGLIGACIAAHGISEIRSEPYPLTYTDDSTKKFADPEDKVFMEVRRARIAQPMDNLAIHYRSFFPEGEPVRPGDKETYVKVKNHRAYKVVYRTKYIRHRKRLPDKDKAQEIPGGWSLRSLTDPATGNLVPVLYGPIIPRERTMYLVAGKDYLYYLFMRADGDEVESAMKKFEDLVHNGVQYK